MNDGQYTNIRNYLEELASQNKQLIAEQKRTNELLERKPLIVYVSGDVDLEQLAKKTDWVEAAPATSKPKASAKKGK